MKQELREVPINQIDVDENYRKTFDEKKLAELARSIRKNGVIQPVVLRPKENRFVLIAGERRLRAAKIADLVTIPSVIRPTIDAVEIVELQLVENIQKEGVQYMEEAYGIAALREKGVLDVKEIASRLGKSDQYVYVALKLAAMPADVRRIAEKGWINKGVAWADQFEAFKKIVRGRTENTVLSEAVDAVMRETGTAVAISGRS